MYVYPLDDHQEKCYNAVENSQTMKCFERVIHNTGSDVRKMFIFITKLHPWIHLV